MRDHSLFAGICQERKNGFYKLNQIEVTRTVIVSNIAAVLNVDEEEEYVLDSSYAFIINELLTGSYDSNLIDYAYPTCINIISKLTNKYAIKSGSTDTDAWVIGYTPDVVLATWAGYDDNDIISSKVVSSNKNSWATAMEGYFKNKESTWYEIPENVSAVLVNPVNGQVASSNDEQKKILYYIHGTEPKALGGYLNFEGIDIDE